MPKLPELLEMRPFEVGDAKFVASWLCGPGLSVPLGSSAWPDRLVRDARIVAMVARAEGQPTGLVRLDCGPDGVAEVTIVVAPEHRRTGRGRLMFAEVLTEARRVGMRRLLAYVDLSNEAALGFFTELGFESHDVVGDRIRMDRIVHAGGQQPPLDVGA